MLVLVMASLASAGTVTISGDTTINVGATKTYTVTYSGTPDIISFDVDVHINNKGSIPTNPATYLATNRNTVYDVTWNPPRDEEGAGIEVTSSSDLLALGTTWFSFSVTATGVKDDVITLTSQDIFQADTDWGTINPTMGTLGITIIPEPMTLVLLGLGGLFLRRRR
jgi:hypothetical protein